MAERRRSSRTDPKAKSSRLERASSDRQALDLRWWRSDQPHDAVWSLVRRISRSTGSRVQQSVFYACLYDDAELGSLMHGSQAIGEWTPQTMVTNLVKRQVDAFVAKLSKNRPVPMALTNGGTYAETRRAKSLSKFFEGVLDEVGYWETRPMLLRDGAVFGTGLAHNYRVGRKLVHERVYPWEIRIDPREAQYGKPRTLYVLRYVDRLMLKERFPKHAEAIDKAEARFEDSGWDIGFDEASDLVLVIEGWHLPSGEDAKDGAHFIGVSTTTLQIEDYKRDYFPFSKFDFSPGITGWWGTGLAQQLEGLQYEANSIGLRLQEQGWMTGTYVWTPPDSGLEVDHVDNGVLTHLQSAVKPEFFNPPAWHPQFFDYYLFLRGRAAAEETRLSEMAVRGEKPPGLESGEAIRRWNSLDDEAFLPQGRADERMAIDTCWQLFDLCEEIYSEAGDEDESFKVRVEKREYGESVMEELEYGKIRLDREEFTLRVFPTSMLKGTPAENYQTVREWMADGIISQDEIYSLLDMPDVQRVLNLRGAARRAVEKILQKILDASDPEAAYVYPEPPMNLELCRALALQTFLDAFTKDAPEENLAWVLQFALDAESEIEAAKMPEPTDPGQPMPAEPMVDPMTGAPVDPMTGAPPPVPGPGEIAMDQTFLPPEEPLAPPGAMAPEAIAPIPGM